MWFKVIELAVRNLLLNKLRSVLTMLGTILGVSSVISMLAIGEGSKRRAVEQIRQLGAANIIVRSVKPKTDDDPSSSSGSASSRKVSRVLQYGLLNDDFERLQATLPTLKSAVPIALVRKNAQHGRHRLANARILGTTPEYLHVKNLAVRRGRFLAEPDLETTASVAVLGAGAAERLFGYEDPLDQTVLLGQGAYRIIGVLVTQDSGGATPGATTEEDFNNDIYIPRTAAQRRFGELQVIVRAGSREYERTQLSEITLTCHDEEQVTQTAAMVRKLLNLGRHKTEDYKVVVPLELLNEAERQKRIWNLVLGSIAGISLLVGGIGIMNIMLATVSERTREIGIRRALGATRGDIIIQFLIESTVLSATGGLLGVVLGVAIPQAVSHSFDIETALSLWFIVIAFGTSVASGIVFGVYPARRAALMDPIEALRHQ